jgi:hypothetical protein
MSGLTGNNILAGSSGQGGYEIEQSLRFNNTGESVYLERTPSADGNKQVATLSFWIKNCGVSNSGATDNTRIMYAGNSTSDASYWQIMHTSAKFNINNYRSGPGNGNWTTDAQYRDPGAWYHYVVSYNQGTVNTYVNGELQSQSVTIGGWSGNVDTAFNSNGVLMRVGPKAIAASVKSIYLAEYHWIDGQALTASDFGETDLLTNQWIPKKYVGTYGTNGFYLNFSDSASLGADSSGNGNNFTPTNLAATDQVLDSPTNNFATLNSLTNYPNTQGVNPQRVFSEGNTRVKHSVNAYGSVVTNVPVNFGKWYVECCVDDLYLNQCGMAVASAERVDDSQHIPFITDNGSGSGWGYDASSLFSMTTGTIVSTPNVKFSDGDIMAMTLDLDSSPRTCEFFKNNVSIVSVPDIDSDGNMSDIIFAFGRRSGPSDMQEMTVNFGQDSSFAGKKTAQNNTDANGIGDFYYEPPSGYLALCEDNLPDPSIADPTAYFNTVLYTGNGSTQSISGVGFQPDFTWIKERTSTSSHRLYDTLRGVNTYLQSNSTDAEGTNAGNGLTSFDADGFSLGSNTAVNESGITHVAWNWKADNTSGSSNTDGTITSTVSANTTAGFSIVSYTGTGVAGDTMGHGLSQAPEVVIMKKRASNGADGVRSWTVWNKDLTDGNYLYLNATNAQFGGRFFGEVGNVTYPYTEPTASLITFGGVNTGQYQEVNYNGDDYIMYCFHSVEGYSKFGSYTGNGSTDGPFVYTGFRPAFVITKAYGSTSSWQMFDSKRSPYNEVDKRLRADTSGAEDTNLERDFLSNGFKIRTNNATLNGSGVNLIYMAFAESPFKYSNAR